MTRDRKFRLYEVGNASSEALATWLNERDPLPYAWHLFEQEAFGQFAVFCRVVLSDEECPERRAVLEQLLNETGKPTTDWDEALAAFAEAPSLEAYEALFQWVPEDVFYQRSRNTFRHLRALGVEPDLLFQCATLHGTTPDGIELAETGAASPEVTIQRGEGSPMQPFWLALAARSAAARGEHGRAVWLAHRAKALVADSTNAILVDEQITSLVEDLDTAHRAML